MHLLLTLAVALASLFHAALKSSVPAKGTAVRSPTIVSLTFTEPVNVSVTTIAIVASDSTVVETLPVQPGPPAATVGAKVRTMLMPGKYLIRWKTVSSDGHVVRDVIPFTVVASH